MKPGQTEELIKLNSLVNGLATCIELHGRLSNTDENYAMSGDRLIDHAKHLLSLSEKIGKLLGVPVELYCDDCQYLSPTEEEQEKYYKLHNLRPEHRCKNRNLNFAVYHKDQHPNIPRPENCPGYKRRTT